jgi:hypothetical protein
MQRTTVRLPDDLLEEAKDRARRTNRTLTQLLEDAVRAELARTVAPVSTRIAERSVQYRVSLAALQQGEHANASSERARSAQHLRDQLRTQVEDIQEFLRAIPDRDTRSADEILGYDANGLPG